MVGIIGITTALILDKCKPTSSVNHISVTLLGKQGELTVLKQQFVELECRIGQDDRS